MISLGITRKLETDTGRISPEQGTKKLASQDAVINADGQTDIFDRARRIYNRARLQRRYRRPGSIV